MLRVLQRQLKLQRPLQRPLLLLGLTALIAAAAQPAERIGGMLRPGMQLVYESGGVKTPWTIDSVVHDTTLGVRTACVRIRLRTAPDQTLAETRAYCADSMMMSTWDGATGQHRAARPLASAGYLRTMQRGGATSTYTTDEPVVETIGAARLTVSPTTVISRDSTGRVTRRLRERFSIGLATATGGAFEIGRASCRERV